MSKAKFVSVIDVVDPDTGNSVRLSVYKHQGGGMLAMDSSYLDQCVDEDDPVIPDPFATKFVKLMLEGD